MGVMVAAGVVLPLVFLTRAFRGPSSPEPASTAERTPALSVDLPAGWHSRLVEQYTGDPALQVANFPLPDSADPLLFDGPTRSRLGPGDVLLLVVDQTSQIVPDEVDVGDAAAYRDDDFAPVEPPVSIGLDDFGARFEGTDPDHALAVRDVRLFGVPISVWAEFGASEPPDDLLADMNAILATLRVAPPREASLVTQADVNDGLSITIPDSWTFHQDPSGPLEPRTVFAVGTWRFPTGGECAPLAATAELPADGALLWLIEYTRIDPGDGLGLFPPNDFPPRPDHFELDESTLANYECTVAPSYLIRFGEAGRFLQVHVAFGPEAPDSLRQQVLAALDSLEVTAPVPDECPAGVGPWSHPACPEQAWVRAIVDAAGHRIVGDTGSALVADLSTTRVYIWATRPDEGAFGTEPLEGEIASGEYALLGDVAGVPVYGNDQTFGGVAVWTVQGLNVWVSAGPTIEDERPGLDGLAPLVQASLEVDYDAIDTRGSTSSTTRPASTPDCGVISLVSEEYGADFEPLSARPGDLVMVSGTTLRGEDGRYAPADRVEVWWNEDVLPKRGAEPSGAAFLVAAQDVLGRCEFALAFSVPDVPPGRYPIALRIYQHPAAEGYGWLAWATFEVTS